MIPALDPAQMAHADRVTAVAAILARAAVQWLQKAEVSLAGLAAVEPQWTREATVKPGASESSR